MCFGISPNNRSNETEGHSLMGERGACWGGAEEREAGKQNDHSVMTAKAEPTQKKRPLKRKIDEG